MRKEFLKFMNERNKQPQETAVNIEMDARERKIMLHALNLYINDCPANMNFIIANSVFNKIAESGKREDKNDNLIGVRV